jgi:hypothetical protein
MLKFSVKTCTLKKQVYICTRQRYTIKNKNNMQIIYGLTHPHENEDMCIHCDWTTYYDWVKEEADIMVEKWNAENPDDTMKPTDWECFVDEAVEEVIKRGDIQTTCSECYDNED